MHDITRLVQFTHVVLLLFSVKRGVVHSRHDTVDVGYYNPVNRNPPYCRRLRVGVQLPMFSRACSNVPRRAEADVDCIPRNSQRDDAQRIFSGEDLTCNPCVVMQHERSQNNTIFLTPYRP